MEPKDKTKFVRVATGRTHISKRKYMTKKVRKILHKEIYQRWKDAQPKSGFSISYETIKNAADLYFRSITHPRAEELYRLAPNMCDEVRRRISKRYPDNYRTDEEQKQWMLKIMINGNPFVQLSEKYNLKEEFSGKHIPVPIYYK